MQEAQRELIRELIAKPIGKEMGKEMGKLIMLEGPDGSGKTVLAKRLYDYLKPSEDSREVILTREPGGTELGERLRSLLVSNNSLQRLGRFYGFQIVRAHLYETLILPELEKGNIVISDRCFLSTYIYQVMNGDIDREFFIHNSKEILKELNRYENYLVVLDIDKEVQKGRLGSRVSKDIFETEELLLKNLIAYRECNKELQTLLQDLNYKCKYQVFNSEQEVDSLDKGVLEFING